MNIIDIQIQLNELYKDKLNKNNISSLADKELLSAPLLIKAYESYFNANIKIMYIGKETNYWLTHSSIELNKRGLNGVYDTNHNLDIDRLLERYDIQMTQQENWNKHAFFRQYDNIKTKLVDRHTNNGSMVWNNIFKMAYDQGKGYSKTSKNHSEKLESISKELFLEELNILKPNILIFVTGSSYDKIIKNFLKEYETDKVIIPKKLWKFKYKDKLCYRTVHPDSIRFTKKEDREDYYQLIIDDIHKEIEKGQLTSTN